MLSVVSRGSEQRTLSSCPSDQPPPVTGKPTGQLWSRRLDGSNNNKLNNSSNRGSPTNTTPTNTKENVSSQSIPKTVQISSFIRETEASSTGDVSIAVERVESIESIEVTSPDYEQQDTSVDYDITSDWKNKTHPGHMLTLLLGSLCTRAVIPEPCSTDRLAVINDAISTASVEPHPNIISCLQKYGWSSRYTFSKPLNAVEAGDLAWDILKVVQVAARPDVISLPINGELGVHWLPSNGVYVAVEIKPDSPAEKFGICVGMRLLSIEGKGITSQRILNIMLAHIQEQGAAVFSFYPDVIDLINLESSPLPPPLLESPTEIVRKNTQFWKTLKKKALPTNILIMLMSCVVVVLLALIFNLYILLLLLLIPLVLLI